jgi:DnaJ family protein C protein 2
MPIKVTPISTLDWPSSPTDLPKAKIQCGTLSYQFYNARKTNKIPIDYYSQYKQNQNDISMSNHSNSSSTPNLQNINTGKKEKEVVAIDLKTLSAKELEDLSYYDILGGIKMHSTQEQIKRAFHKACLKYHPDKEESNSNAANANAKTNGDAKTKTNGDANTKTNGDAEKSKTKSPKKDKSPETTPTKKKGEDPVFLKVKEAFETLSDPKLRKSYDSTVDFDDSIPSQNSIKKEKDFYKMFGRCFERNLRFAAENEPGFGLKNKKGGGGSSSSLNKKGKRKNNGSNGNGKKKSAPPVLGDENTPIDQVHIFYDYWVRFESWRDFTLPATKETEHDTDMAECRYEKRWMEKEILRKAKAMKRDEMARIQKLVDKSMALDPRLKREKKRIEQEKEDKIRMKKEKQEREERERKEKEEMEGREKEEREKKEKEEKANAKLNKEREKKILRKARQALRKAVMAEYNIEAETNYKTWDSVEEMSDDVELLCKSLCAVKLGAVTSELADTNDHKLTIIRDKANDLKVGAAKKSKEDLQKRDALRKAAAEKEEAQKAARASKPWTKEELSALAKAVKKYPAGSANRWGTIALFINNLCKLADPRKKEECIEKYNAIASSAAPKSASTSTPSSSDKPKPTNDKDSSNTWTEEQDKQLQDGLAKFPSTMDKNERWTSIANEVDEKNKKECVQRFKAIREALKKK